MGWVVQDMKYKWKMRSVYKILGGKLEGKRPLGRHKRRW
jgi:hypothetical protein